MKYRSACLALAILPALLCAQNAAKVYTVLPGGKIQMYDSQVTPHTVAIKAPTSVASNVVWTLPGTDGSGPLCSDGATNLSFTCTSADFNSLAITRSGVTRVTLLAGSAGTGGLIRTYNAAGDTILNALDENGADLLTLKVNGTTAIDASGNGTLATLGIVRSGVTRVSLLAGSAGTGGLFRTWNAAGDTILNSIDQAGGDFQSLKINGNTFTDVSRNTTVNDLTVLGTCTGCLGGLPVADTTPIVKGSSDATKLIRFEVDGLTTATTRVLTPQDADYTIAGLETSNLFTAVQTFDGGWSVTRTAGATTRVTALNGGAGAGGILNTYDSAGTTIINRLDQYGLSIANGGTSRGMLTLGTAGAASGSTTPTVIAMDSTYGTGTLGKNFKLQLYEASGGTNNIYGLGISAGVLEVTTGTTGAIAFFQNAASPTELARFATGGFSIGGTIVVDASRNASMASYAVSGTSVIDSSRNGSLVSLAINGNTFVDSSRNITVASCTGCLSTLSQDITFSADNTYSIGSTSNALASVYSHAYTVYRSSTDLRISMLAGSAFGSGSISIYDYNGNIVNSISSSGISSTIGFVANGSSGLSATFDPNTCTSLTFTYGILTAKAGC